MTKQLRDILENALAARQPAGPNERKAVYDDVRRRLDRYIVGRSLANEQKGRLRAALEQVIDEIESRCFVLAAAPTSFSPHAKQGDVQMTTSPQPEKIRQSSGRNIAIAAVAVAAIAATAGGWYWWSQRAVRCVVGSEAATPIRLHNMTEAPEGLAVTGVDPQIFLDVPQKQSDSKVCVRVKFTSSNDGTMEVFLPDPDVSEDSFVAERSIKEEFVTGENDISIKIPVYTAGRRIRIDPGIGGPNGGVIVNQIRFGIM